MIQYGFIEHGSDKIKHIYPARVLVALCFGSEAIAAEHGRIVKVKIEVIE